jgi:hypothetical protein
LFALEIRAFLIERYCRELRAFLIQKYFLVHAVCVV